MRLHLACVEIKHGCPLGIQFYIIKVIAILIDVFVEFPNSYPIIKYCISVLHGKRQQISSRGQTIGREGNFERV